MNVVVIVLSVVLGVVCVALAATVAWSVHLQSEHTELCEMNDTIELHHPLTQTLKSGGLQWKEPSEEDMKMFVLQGLQQLMTTKDPAPSKLRPDVYENYLHTSTPSNYMRLPIAEDGRDFFNHALTRVTTDGNGGMEGVLIGRNDDLTFDWKGQTYYSFTTVKINATKDFLWSTAPVNKVRFTEDNRDFTVEFRTMADGVGKCVVEDLRAVVGSFDLVSGVLVCGLMPTVCKSALFRCEPDGVIERVCVFDSPTDSPVEKNWLLVQKDSGIDILHSFGDTLDVYHVSEEQGWKMELLANVPAGLPHQWKVPAHVKCKVSSIHLSCLGSWSDQEWVLLVHRRNAFPGTLFYEHFCLFVDKATYAPTRFVPDLVCSDITIGVSFAMQIITDKSNVHIVLGVADRVGGVKSYPRELWESHSIAWPTK